MQVNREKLLAVLQAVSPGLAEREAVEQSSCFAFIEGRVITFNDEIAVTAPLDIGFNGAVPAKPLLAILGKLNEVDIDISMDGGEVLIKGKGRRSGLVAEAEIALPISVVEVPDEEAWLALHPEFTDAIGVAVQCASRDAGNYVMTCVHITPTLIEACDNFQALRYPIETPVTECLIKAPNIKKVVGLGVMEVAETDGWLHFRNKDGLIFSVRRDASDYQDISRVFAAEGIQVTLPGGMAEAVQKASIFSSGDIGLDVLTVEFRTGAMRIRGASVTGWYEERKTVSWNGDPMIFTIPPGLLSEIVTRTNDCYLSPGRLKIDGGRYVYVTCLGTPKE